MTCCKECGAALSFDERAIYRRLISREAETFLCKRCLAAYFSCDVALIDKKIGQFKADGCLLFFPEKEI